MKENKFRSVLKAIYTEPQGITQIKGFYKTGKTDFTLHLLEILMNMKLIHEAAGNVRVFQDKECQIPVNEPVKYIDNFVLLKAWLFRNTRRKMFIFDEAMANAPSKKAMTTLNAEWQRVIPELSKAKCHLMTLTQEETMTEKIFAHRTFNVATWTKIDLPRHHSQYRKRVKVSSKLLKETLIFNNISRTNINFNPYLSALWSMEPTSTDQFEDTLELKVLMDYANGKSYPTIAKTYEELYDRTSVARAMRRGLKVLFRMCQVSEVSSGIEGREI